MAATGFFYTFTRPRQALPMSMLKYDPIGKDTTTIPPTRRDETRRDEDWEEDNERMEAEATRKSRNRWRVVPGKRAAENFRGTDRQTWPAVAANPPDHSAEKGALP